MTVKGWFVVEVVAGFSEGTKMSDEHKHDLQLWDILGDTSDVLIDALQLSATFY